ncbi:hypothetical protein RRG08_020687 [Elysia crispata]|uniref:Uncharacterized protein n=1 Tax=Elysia crispata TaxID=231223 RepID=A0AAE0Z4G7_9GAST|nr:hypothetical protein RRG08_020687 [Elysia crispata]
MPRSQAASRVYFSCIKSLLTSLLILKDTQNTQSIACVSIENVPCPALTPAPTLHAMDAWSGCKLSPAECTRCGSTLTDRDFSTRSRDDHSAASVESVVDLALSWSPYSRLD